MTSVIVSSVVANKYRNGGAVLTSLSWAAALRALGFRVYLVEQIDRKSCTDEHGEVAAFKTCAQLAYFRRMMKESGLAKTSALIYEGGEEIEGVSAADLADLAREAAMLINVSGHLTYRPVFDRVREKVYIDLDPGFTQFWHADGLAGARLEGHDHFFTVGENIGAADCIIPTSDIAWKPVRQPCVLEDWPVSTEGDPKRFTTVGSWRGPFGSIYWKEHVFGLKLHEFRKFMELPRRSPYTYELALDIHPAEVNDLEALHANGWQLVDPSETVPDPDSFRRYVQGSGAEFSAAQGVYVGTNSGWFSDRTVRYLASGKPALVQETGFSRNYPTGEGLLAFGTVEAAAAGAEQIQGDYDLHCRAARRIAEEYFSPQKALGPLLESVNVAP